MTLASVFPFMNWGIWIQFHPQTWARGAFFSGPDSGSPWPHPPFSYLQGNGETMGSKKSAWSLHSALASHALDPWDPWIPCSVTITLPPGPVYTSSLSLLSQQRNTPHRVHLRSEMGPRDSCGQAAWTEFLHVSWWTHICPCKVPKEGEKGG